MRSKYPEGMEEFVRANAQGRRDDELTVLVNEKFGLNLKVSQVKNYRSNRKIRNGLKPGVNWRHPRKYTDEMLKFFADNIKGRGRAEMAALMTERFGVEFTVINIKSIQGNHKLWSGLTGRFEKGHVPANKGKHPPTVGRMAETQFKKGQRAMNARPVGSLRLGSDGYIYIKWQEFHRNKNWKQLHKYIYELAYGEIPKGYLVTFKDGNKEHIALDNLELISMRQNVRMNQKGLRQLQVDGIYETAKAVADLTIAIAEAEKKKRGSHVRKNTRKQATGKSA